MLLLLLDIGPMTLKSNFSGLDLIDQETLDYLKNPKNGNKRGSNLSSIFNENSMSEGVKAILSQFEAIEKELDTKKEWVNFTKEMRLTDLFEIIYGIPEQSNPLVDEIERPVKFLKSSLRRKIEKSPIEKDENSEQVIRGNVIDNKYVIRDKDILINTKGAPKVSQAENPEIDKYAYVPSHQFILLRPRAFLIDSENPISIDIALRLVRFSLQILLMKEYNEAKDFEKKNNQTSKDSLTVRIPALKLKDLESINLKIPFDSLHADQLKAILQMHDLLEDLYVRLFDLETKIGGNIINFKQSKNFLPYRKKMSRYLTKSRFKEALECVTKLYYTKKKEEYANTQLADPFLEALAKGGFQVGELAKYYFADDPVAENITITTLDYEDAIAETKKRLSQPGRVVIAEAAFKFENLFIRADIVVKENDTLHLYEVKAKSASDENEDTDTFLSKKGDKVKSEWVPYIYDLAFQKYVMAHCAFSRKYKIKAHLTMANKDAAASIDGLNQNFKITKKDDGGYKVVVPNGLTRNQLGTKILKNINLDEVIEKVWRDFAVPTDIADHMSFVDFVEYASGIYSRNEQVYTGIGKKCKTCQYINKKDDNGLKSGFHECWKNHTRYSDELLAKPLVTELWGGKAGNQSLTQKLIDKGIYLLEKTKKENFATSGSPKPEPGLTPLDRRMIQVEKVINNDLASYFDKEGLVDAMKSWSYPLHFIDFETSMVALPFHQGLKPYQGIAFQFSHHVMHQDGRVEHKGQFLATDPGVYPNYEFIRALKLELETDKGTIFRYHNHENSYLNMIAKQLKNNPDAPEDAADLIAFIRNITQWKENGEDVCGPRNMVDLYDLVLRYYYSPYAKGSNSLKQILPAIIKDSTFLRNKYGTTGMYGKELAIQSLNFDDHVWIDSGKNDDPYKTLPPVFEEYDRNTLDELIKDFDEVGDGGAALTAYNYLQFAEVPEQQRTHIANALLRYCELDTLAMVMIVEGWRNWEF